MLPRRPFQTGDTFDVVTVLVENSFSPGQFRRLSFLAVSGSWSAQIDSVPAQCSSLCLCLKQPGSSALAPLPVHSVSTKAHAAFSPQPFLLGTFSVCSVCCYKHGRRRKTALSFGYLCCIPAQAVLEFLGYMLVTHFQVLWEARSHPHFLILLVMRSLFYLIIWVPSLLSAVSLL